VISSATGSGAGSIRTLSNTANDYSGDTLLSGGTFKLGASNVIPDGSSKGNVIFSAASGTATLDLAGRSETINGLASSGLGSNVVDNSTASTNSTLTVGGNDQSATFNGVIKNTGASATLALTKTGAGTQTLSGVNSYTGATTISQGTLALGATGSITSSNIIVGASTTFDVSGVTGGYTLGAAQTLSGTGSVVGSTVVAGTLSPGNSPGSMSVGSQTWVNGGDYNWQILDATGVAGTGFDTIAMTGTLDLSSLTTGQFGINLWSLASISPDVSGNALNFNNTLTQSWNLLTASVAITGFDATDFVINTGASNGTGGFSNDLGGGVFSLGTNGNSLVLNFTAVPEPNVAMLLGGLGVFVLLRRRRN
jgi:autotransporter-associated beta strand protein